MTAAPLKQRCGMVENWRRRTLRGHMTAAPLKRKQKEANARAILDLSAVT